MLGRVVGRVGAIGRNPAPAAMQSSSKHDRHSRERQRPDVCMGRTSIKWGGRHCAMAPNDPKLVRLEATKEARCGYHAVYKRAPHDPSNAHNKLTLKSIHTRKSSRHLQPQEV